MALQRSPSSSSAAAVVSRTKLQFYHRSFLLLPVVVVWCLTLHVASFSWTTPTATTRLTFRSPRRQSLRVAAPLAAAVQAPTREDTTTQRPRKKNRDDNYEGDEELDDYPDLEYLQDMQVSREMNDPFHILLLGSTFDDTAKKGDNPYVSASLQYVLGLQPASEATELAQAAYDHGMSCLGTWPREECLTLGRQLQVRDIKCRVVPFCEGGQRGWQAKRDAGADASQRYSGGGGGAAAAN